jgi:16S rRNA processing protein RimM
MHESSSPSHDFLTLADIVGVYGIKGWVRLRVSLDDPNLLLSLPDLTLVAAAGSPQSARQSVVVEALQAHGKGHIARLSGIVDRTQAEALRGREIQVAAADFPTACDDEVYWRDLEGLEVWCTEDGSRSLLGKVKTLLETGANDVLVVAPCEGSIDDREHLIPWIPNEVVTDIALADRKIEGSWYVDA